MPSDLTALLLTREYPPDVYGGAGVHADYLSRELARLIAANDGRLTLAARNRNPGDMDDEEVLALYWQIQELSR